MHTPTIQELLDRDFATIAELIAAQAEVAPRHPALIQDQRRIDFAALDAAMDRVAAALQRDGLRAGDTIALCAPNSIDYALTFLGAVRVGVAVAPLAPGSSAESLKGMLSDCAAKLLFLDESVATHVGSVPSEVAAKVVGLGFQPSAGLAFESWLAPEGARPTPVDVDPDSAFNIIYSSGTTGLPKGIVQPHRMRWGHVRRGGDSGYGPESVTLVSTPMYSNTTLVSFLPGLSLGGAVVLMAKFDARKFLQISEQEQVTHAMLVPVQYQRIMDILDADEPAQGRFDLSSYRMKFCTSAPFSAELKARVLARWPGGLVEYYGMTEGGGTCILRAHLFPNKLHTVGQPAPGHDIRLIDDSGHEVALGETGEVVGSSKVVMTGYHNQPGKTSEAEWFDDTGKRFIRTGDVGRFDSDGFLTLLDRKKDMIISGGFNIYPSDLESVLVQHPAVVEAAVVGVPSTQWGETPVAFVVCKPGHEPSAAELKDFVGERVGKTQRLSDIRLVDALPRSSIGKVLKRQLRDEYSARSHQ